MSSKPLHVAIVGGGLCGLSLAIALTKRSISYTIYEARGSFTEIGAGINLGPNTIQAFDIIDPDISKKIYALSTRNAPGKETVWMQLRLGAPTENFADGHLIHEMEAPPTGNMTVSRNELLQLLARSTRIENARFNKKLTDVQQTDDGATIIFEDGTRDWADVVIGCDGAHSTVRRLLLGPENPATFAQFSNTGGYRAVFPMVVHEQAVGAEKAHMSTLWIGPGAYVINYPINGGKDVNIGLWPRKDGEWDHDSSWIIPKQKPAMLRDFGKWGEHIHNIMNIMGDDTAFWATFHHSIKPKSYSAGRLCMIGDASHSMCPHQGQGAAQSMEDACVMAEVLHHIDSLSSREPMAAQIEAAFSGYGSVRKPRFEMALDTSKEAHTFISNIWRPDLSAADLDDCRKRLDERFRWMWQPDIKGQGERAKAEMERLLLGRARM